MTELKDDNSYIAQRQREDAQEALKAIGSAGGAKGKGVRLPFRIQKRIIAFVVSAAVVFASFQTLGILSYKGVIPKASEIADQLGESENEYHTVSYLCYGVNSFGSGNLDEGGNIEGESDQIVADGESATTVMAFAEEDWYFAGWIDSGNIGIEDLGFIGMFGLWDSVITSDKPYRTDTNITSDIQPIAVFMEMGDSGDGDGDGDGDGEPDDGDGNGAGDEGEPGDGDGDGDGNGQSSNDPHGNPGNGNNSAGGGNPKQDNTFLDGQTEFKDFYGEYYEGAKEQISDGSSLPDDIREIIEGYYDGLKP